MKTIIALVGPTAVGKTDAGFRLIKDGFPFEIISADSRQVYRFMDIGTGKDIPQNNQTKIWLIDVVNPDEPFSSAQYCHQTHIAINDIFSMEKIPLIIGGTGRYLKDLVTTPETLSIPPNLTLRHQLSTFSVPKLQQLLLEKNPAKLEVMNQSDRNNPRRLVRAIETSQNKTPVKSVPFYQVHTFCLTAPLTLIVERITSRVQKRLEQGMIHEVEQLLLRYPDFRNFQSSATPGYQELIAYQDGQITLQAAIDKWTKREIDYAKRQLTWFKHQTDSVWFDISQPSWYAEVVRQLKRVSICQK